MRLHRGGLDSTPHGPRPLLMRTGSCTRFGMFGSCESSAMPRFRRIHDRLESVLPFGFTIRQEAAPTRLLTVSVVGLHGRIHQSIGCGHRSGRRSRRDSASSSSAPREVGNQDATGNPVRSLVGLAVPNLACQYSVASTSGVGTACYENGRSHGARKPRWWTATIRMRAPPATDTAISHPNHFRHPGVWASPKNASSPAQKNTPRRSRPTSNRLRAWHQRGRGRCVDWALAGLKRVGGDHDDQGNAGRHHG